MPTAHALESKLKMFCVLYVLFILNGHTQFSFLDFFMLFSQKHTKEITIMCACVAVVCMHIPSDYSMDKTPPLSVSILEYGQSFSVGETNKLASIG